MLIYQNNPDSQSYLTDHFAYGPLDLLEKYWGTYQTHSDTRFPELFLMETYFGTRDINIIREQIFLLQELCYANNISIYFTKPEYSYQGNMILKWYRSNSYPPSIETRTRLNIGAHT